MLLRELFDNGGQMMGRMRQAVLDAITPLVSQDVPFITVNQVIDTLKNKNFGVSLDRGLIMQLLNPDEVKSVSKIEGDRIYFDQPEDATRDVDQADEEKDKEHVEDMAQKQAKSDISQKDDIAKQQANAALNQMPK